MGLMQEKHRFAEVLIRVGLALENGQPIYIEAPVEAAEFVSLLLDEAYKAGAGTTHVHWTSDAADKVRAFYREPQPLEQEQSIAEQFADNGAGYIRLVCPDFLTGLAVDAQRINQLTVISNERRRLFRNSPRRGGFTLACVPCSSWADKVFPELGTAAERLDALWETVLGCMRCHEPDPVAAWEQYKQRTRERKAKLNKNSYCTYRFRSATTDLELSPAGGAAWFGGYIEYPDERIFIPNLPTEEVFSVPHRYKVNGYATATLPLNYNGSLIENFTIEFREGRIVAARAEKGQELLDTIINTDEGSHYLGEFALVDQCSPIARTGKVFYTTLFDENASCHLAIGMIAGQMSLENAEEQGLNQSKVHVDFMFGSSDLAVTAQRPDGSWDNIMINGQWADEFK